MFLEDCERVRAMAGVNSALMVLFALECDYSFLNSCTDPMSDVLLSSTFTAFAGSHIG